MSTGYGQQPYGESPYGMPEESTPLTAGDGVVTLPNATGAATIHLVNSENPSVRRATVDRVRANPSQSIEKPTVESESAASGRANPSESTGKPRSNA